MTGVISYDVLTYPGRINQIFRHHSLRYVTEVLGGPEPAVLQFDYLVAFTSELEADLLLDYIYKG